MTADEADQDGSKQFLIFAGVFYPAGELSKLHTKVAELRKNYGYEPQDLLKSSPGTKPDQVSRDGHKDIKNDILALAAETGCKVCCYVTPHAIAKNQTLEKKLQYGTNTLLIKFEQFLRENQCDAGMAFFDQTTDYSQDQYLKEVFDLGLEFPNGRRKKLERIVAIDSTSIGQSHLTSITDIVVGAFRFVANEPDKNVVGKILTQSLEKIMSGIMEGNTLNASERGLCIRPKKIDHPDHQADIAAFRNRLEELSH